MGSNTVFINETEKYPITATNSSFIGSTFFNSSIPSDISNSTTIVMERLADTVTVRVDAFSMTLTGTAAFIESTEAVPNEFRMTATSFEPLFVTINGNKQSVMGTISVSAVDGKIRIFGDFLGTAISAGSFSILTTNMNFLT